MDGTTGGFIGLDQISGGQHRRPCYWE
jgi:hypothetical protein